MTAALGLFVLTYDRPDTMTGTDSGALVEIRRIFFQNGRRVEANVSSITDVFAAQVWDRW